MTKRTSAEAAAELEAARADLERLRAETAEAAARVSALQGVLRAVQAREAAAREAERKRADAAARTKAKRLAAKIGVEIELHDDLAADAWYVDHPTLRDTEADPHAGDHYCYSWTEILARVESYAAALSKEPIQ